jgi:hypothetical protein
MSRKINSFEFLSLRKPMVTAGWVLLASGVSGCLTNKTLTTLSGNLSKVELNAVACEQSNFLDPLNIYYPSAASCQKSWPAGGCSPIVVLYKGGAYTCFQHAVSAGGGTTGGGTTGGGTTGGGTTGGGTTGGGTTGGGTTGGGTTGTPAPSFSFSSHPSGHNFGFVNSNDASSSGKTVTLTLTNSGGASSSCAVSVIAPAGFTVPANYFSASVVGGASACANLNGGQSCSVQVQTALPGAGVEWTAGLRVQCAGGVDYSTATSFLKVKGAYSTLLQFYSSMGTGPTCGNNLPSPASARVYHKIPIDWNSLETPVLYTDGSATAVLPDISSRKAIRRLNAASEYHMWWNQGGGVLVQECKVGDPW